jgi:NADH:ubiquinone oxidoreductase subunit E
MKSKIESLQNRNLNLSSGSTNVLRTLLSIQENLGAVPADAVDQVAGGLGVTAADVAGVLSFYPDLRTRRPGRHVVRLCMGESCVANHCKRVMGALAEELRIGLGATTPDGRFTLERVYCVGNCAVSPTVMVDEDVHGRVTPAGIPELLAKYR